MRRRRQIRRKTLKHVGTQMALLTYNMKRVVKILSLGGLIEAIHAFHTALGIIRRPPRSLRPIACCLVVDDHGTATSTGRPSCLTALPRRDVRRALPRVTFVVEHKVQTHEFP